MPNSLVPAAELARRSPVRFPNESAEYRAARTALLAEEIELRRHLERVAAQRRALPPGGEVIGDYRFQSERGGMLSFADLFGDKQTLAIYSYMFGPQRERPCPMCTNLLGGWEGNAADIDQRIALAVVARSPIERLIEWKEERGWKNLQLYSDLNGNYSRDYHGAAAGWHGNPQLQRFHPSRPQHSPLLGRRNDRRFRRPRSGPSWRARPRPTVERAGHDAGRARRGLVSEVGLRSVIHILGGVTPVNVPAMVSPQGAFQAWTVHPRRVKAFLRSHDEPLSG